VHARLAVGGVVFRDDGRVLLIQRARAPLAGTWSLPGGKVEPGESTEAAVVREVLEETGLAVVAVRLVEVVTLGEHDARFEIHEWRCALAAGTRPDEAHAADDALDVRWASEAEWDTLALTAEVIGVIRRARDVPP
jgi:acetyl-CoA carboxylase carboxyl transferase subunit beta